MTPKGRSQYKSGLVGGRSHGYSQTSTYRTWYHMIERCRNTASISFKYYGAKGIDVCDQWMVFEEFLKDMGDRPIGMQLDRINNTLGYNKDNCRWVSDIDQQRNRTSVKLTLDKANEIRALFAGGATHKELAAAFGVDKSTISRIVNYKQWI